MLLNFDKLGAWRWMLVAICVLVAMFLVLPILFIVALSFGDSRWLIFPPPSWTLDWYRKLFADARWLASAWTSAKIALAVTVLSVALGFLSSIALVRGSFRGRELLRGLFLTPMILPVVILAVALYILFLRLGLNGTFLGFVTAHLVIALPFSIMAISSALEGFDPAIENAAILCGASRWEARWRITVPCISHGLFAAAIFSFLASWDEVVLAIFMASPTLQTLPVRVYTTLRQDLTPVIAAASTLLVGLTLVLMTLAAWLRRRSSG